MYQGLIWVFSFLQSSAIPLLRMYEISIDYQVLCIISTTKSFPSNSIDNNGSCGKPRIALQPKEWASISPWIEFKTTNRALIADIVYLTMAEFK